MNYRNIFFTLITLTFALASFIAHAVDVPGGSEKNPADITSLLLSNQDVNFTGGYYVVRIPQSGAGIVEVSSIDVRISDVGSTGYSTKNNPSIRYTGRITGNGTLKVQSAFNTNVPGFGELFSGGALVFTNPNGQNWGIEGVSSGAHRPSALIIDPNTTVVFWFPGEADRAQGVPAVDVFPAAATVSRNITNNGFLFSLTANTWASITGTGINSFGFWGGDRGILGNFKDARYSGHSFHTANGCKWSGLTWMEDQPNGNPTALVTRGLTVFEPRSTQSLLSANYKPDDSVKLISNSMYNWGLNIQLWWNGIHQFTGLFLPTTASESFIKLAPASDAVKGVYSYNGGGMAFGRVINLNNRATLLMGDGREIITNADGITTNVWLQGNPFNTLLSTSNFVNGYPGQDAQALAYNYSGTYRVNHNFNARVDAGKSIITGIRNDIWTNLYFLNPRLYNPKASQPNHAIVTTTVFFGGLVRIDKNAILQLGDGTIGNKEAQKTLNFSDGRTATYPYHDSGGNGMLITKGNQRILPDHRSKTAAVMYEIRNNGKLIVNNTPGALDATTEGASPEVAAWVSANILDGITGSGKVEQIGKLPLTLGSINGNSNTYTGGTFIGTDAVLIAGSASALGNRDAAAGKSSGRVVNGGTLQAAKGIRIINVPGDYVQGKSEVAGEQSVQPRKVFTNNGDGKHDTWWIRLREDIIGPVKVVVYSRYGQEVFRSDDYPATYYEEPAPEDGRTGWDGTHKGQLLPPDAYYYIITIPDTKTVRGAVTILR